MALALIINSQTHPSAKKYLSKVDFLEYRLDDLAELPKSPKKAIFTKPTEKQLQSKPDYFDLDYQSGLFTKTTNPTICSYHNFKETPNLEKIYQELQKKPAKLYKIATWANSSLDSLRMIRFRRKHPNVIGICMGEKGLITRLTAPICGQHHTYTTLQKNNLGIPHLDDLLTTYYYRQLSPKTKLYALIGDPVTLSPSHITHNQTFRKMDHDGLYVKIPLTREELPKFMPYLDLFAGLSVTHPLKTAIIPYLPKIDPNAAAIGAVNTISQGCGYNTDGKGAWDAIGKAPGTRVAILGRGGAARAAAYEARKRGLQPILYHRQKKLAPYDFLINATPLGMKGELALSEEQITPGATVLDMVIGETPLIQLASKKKCRVIRGIEMFHKQAKHQLALFMD